MRAVTFDTTLKVRASTSPCSGTATGFDACHRPQPMKTMATMISSGPAKRAAREDGGVSGVSGVSGMLLMGGSKRDLRLALKLAEAR